MKELGTEEKLATASFSHSYEREGFQFDNNLHVDIHLLTFVIQSHFLINK